MNTDNSIPIIEGLYLKRKQCGSYVIRLQTFMKYTMLE